MSRIASDFSARPAGFNAYLSNLSVAFGSLCSALFAVKPHAPVAAVQAKRSARAPVGMVTLYRMACQSDSLSPILADELRFLAARA